MPSPLPADALGNVLNTFVTLLTDAVVAGAKAAIAKAGPLTPPPAKRGPGRPPKSAATPKPAPAAAAPAKRGPGRPPKNGKACLVPGCGKKTVAKGLCQGHYRKAARIGVLNKLDKTNLAKLNQDGRATRWAKKK